MAKAYLIDESVSVVNITSLQVVQCVVQSLQFFLALDNHGLKEKNPSANALTRNVPTIELVSFTLELFPLLSSFDDVVRLRMLIDGFSVAIRCFIFLRKVFITKDSMN